MPEIECVVGTLSAQPRFFYFNAAAKVHVASLCTVLLLSLLAAPVFAQTQIAAPAQTEEHHRLSGIIGSAHGHSVAIIESPDGRSVMLHVGDAFEDGRVAEISERSMMVRYAHGDRRFWLASSGAISTDRLSAQGKPSLVIAKDDTHPTLQRTVAKVSLVARLDELITTGRAKGQTLDDVLRPLLELPKQVRIVEIDHQPLGSTLDSLKNIRGALAQGHMVSLGIEGDPGKQMMYVLPRSDNADGMKE